MKPRTKNVDVRLLADLPENTASQLYDPACSKSTGESTRREVVGFGEEVVGVSISVVSLNLVMVFLVKSLINSIN